MAQAIVAASSASCRRSEIPGGTLSSGRVAKGGRGGGGCTVLLSTR
ncbi:hypothetical protein NFJ02_11g05350 [Pycnococcus provasolii]